MLLVTKPKVHIQLGKQKGIKQYQVQSQRVQPQQKLQSHWKSLQEHYMASTD